MDAAGRPFVTVRHSSVALARDVVIGSGCYIGCLEHYNDIVDQVHIGLSVSTDGHVCIDVEAQIGIGASYQGTPLAHTPSSTSVLSLLAMCPPARPLR